MAYAVVAVASIGAVWPSAEASAQWHPSAGPKQPAIESGLAFTWGNNQTGELGQGNDKDSPVPLAIPKLGWPISAISTGTDGSLALTRRGRVWAWGGNDQGQLGIGSQQWHNAPVMVKGPGGRGPLSRIIAVSSGNVASAALNADGHVFTWGDNIWGQLGNGTVDGPGHCPTSTSQPPGPSDVCSKLPVSVVGASGRGTLSGVVAIAGSSDDDLALRSDGTVWTWGINVSGQLGIGTHSGPGECKPYSHYAAVGCSTKPVEVVGPGGKGVLNHVVAVAGGADFNVALRADGTVWSWGIDDYGQLGNGKSEEFDNLPSEVVGPDGQGHLRDVVSIAAGGGFSMARLSNGSIWTWGENSSGQLGIGNATGPSVCTTEHTPCSLVPVQVKGPDGAGTFSGSVAISAGQVHAAALRAP
jgi:alpha-tubulin suppressor-like RCC1 family protein